MLTAHLNNVPYSKFVLIQDNVEHRGNCLLMHLKNTHLETSKVLYFNFQVNLELSKVRHSNLQVFDYVTDVYNWNNKQPTNFCDAIKSAGTNGAVVIIDSLVHAIFQYGWNTIYRELVKLLDLSKGVLRIVAVFHKDICQDITKTYRYFEHLSTLTINLEANSNLNRPQVSYTIKKNSGKTIKKIEEYKFEDGSIQSYQISKVESQIVEESEILPENLTTFKISLDDKEKELRDQLILPYLPKENQEQIDSNIHYSFDKIDDWDEEDPDDDLNI